MEQSVQDLSRMLCQARGLGLSEAVIDEIRSALEDKRRVDYWRRQAARRAAAKPTTTPAGQDHDASDQRTTTFQPPIRPLPNIDPVREAGGRVRRFRTPQDLERSDRPINAAEPESEQVRERGTRGRKKRDRQHAAAERRLLSLI